MFPGILGYVDLVLLLWAWAYQWTSILRTLISVAATSSPEYGFIADVVGSPSGSWHITVFVGIFGILVTNVLGAMYFYRGKKFLLAALAACDMDTPFLVVTQARDYVQGCAPDVQELRRRNALWRGLPCSAVSVFVAIRGAGQTSMCQYVTQVQMLTDPSLHSDSALDVYPPLETEICTAHCGPIQEISSHIAASLQEKFGESSDGTLHFGSAAAKCPKDRRQIQAVNSLEEYRSATGLLDERVEEVRQFRDLSAFQIGLREFIVDAVSVGLEANFPKFTTLLGFDSKQVDDFVLETANANLAKGWNKAGMDQADVQRYSDPYSARLLFQAAVQLLVAVRGLAQHVRDQRRLSLKAVGALYVHIFLDALLAIGCLIILFSVIPAKSHLQSSKEAFLQEFRSYAHGTAWDVFVECYNGQFDEFFKSWTPNPRGLYECFDGRFDSDIFPHFKGNILQVVDVVIDGLEGLHTPAVAVELVMLMKMTAVCGLLCGILRGLLGKVCAHALVTSPVVLLGEEVVEPWPLAIQMAVKTAAVVSPYIYAMSTWAELKVVAAQMLRLRVANRVVYFVSLGVYVTILLITGGIVIVHMKPGDDSAGSNAEELVSYPFPQRCCAADRKTHKPAVGGVATRAADLEAGAAQGLLGQAARNYGGCADACQPAMCQAG